MLCVQRGIGQVSYEASPTATTLRDALISLGLMAAAPAAAPVSDREWLGTDDREWLGGDERDWQNDES